MRTTSLVRRGVINQPWLPIGIPGLIGWYDPSDLTTLFQDTGGTTSVTAFGQSVAMLMDKSGNGNHHTQSVSDNRPTYAREPITGRRNLIVNSNFAILPTVSSGVTVEVVDDSQFLADSGLPESAPVLKVTFSGANNSISYAGTVGALGNFTGSIYARAQDISSPNIDVRCAGSGGSGTSGQVTPSVGLYTRLSGNFVSASTSNFMRTYSFGAGVVYITMPQLEAGHISPTQYQTSITRYDVTEEGVESRYFLQFDGSNDILVGGAVHGENRSVVVGVTRLNSSEVIYGGSSSINARSYIGFDTGSSSLAAGVGSSTGTTIHGGGNWNIGVPTVGTLRHNSGLVNLRRDGVQVFDGTYDGSVTPGYQSGMGGLNEPTITVRSSCQIFGVVDIARSVTDVEVAQIEAWVNSKTRAF